VTRPTPITTIGLVTADRPALVHRSLESLVRHCTEFEHHPRFVVIDGSRDPRNRTATHAAAIATAAAGGYDLQYVGMAEASRVRAELAARDPSASLLAPGTAGENRNLLLLLTAGENILAVDDDVLCETWALPARNDALAVMGHRQELLETAFFPDRPAARGAVANGPVDLLEAHGALLGQSLGLLIARAHGRVDLTHACGHLRSAILDDCPLSVKVTLSGLVGDAAIYCPYRLLFDRGPVRARLWASRTMFATAMASREVSRAAGCHVVTHDCSCMATCMGLSNHALLPPFMPAHGNEDGLFGGVLAACDPSAIFGHVPCGILHDSSRPSERAETRILSATQSRLSELVMALVPRCLPRDAARSPEARMGVLGRGLMELGGHSRGALADLVREVTWDVRTSELAQADRAAEDPGCPDYWRAALKRYRDELSRSASTREFFLPVEFHGFGSVDAGYRALQTFFVTFGQLVASWPALWEAARMLNAHRARAG
jgi:hypothetical protein